jgi:thiosulfate reductase cytochrome b subunit
MSLPVNKTDDDEVIDAPTRRRYYRHTLPVRIMHWVNVVAFFTLLMSGLQIFNAHPALNWGKSSYDGRPPLLEIGAAVDADGRAIGTTNVLGHTFETTGLLGASKGEDGELEARAFPAWSTLPGPRWLSMARSWHFFAAWIFVINGIVYFLYGFASRHFARDIVPAGEDWTSIGRSLMDHLRFRHPVGEAATRYNILQKIAYLAVIFVLLPGIVIAGWAMSPYLDSLLPGWVNILGGRQSARTLHFIIAFLLLGFVGVHVFEVIATGVWNNLRSMITGGYDVPPEKNHE